MSEGGALMKWGYTVIKTDMTERMSSLHMKTGQEGSPLQTRKRVLVLTQMGWHLDLGIPKMRTSRTVSNKNVCCFIYPICYGC